LTFSVLCPVILAARYLRNQREQMNLAANAKELRKALQSLLIGAGKSQVVTVPSGLVMQASTIETAQIAKERKDAILQSINSPTKEYAVEFDGDAVKQRAMLELADRVELEDLVEQFDAKTAELDSQAEAGAGVTPLRAATETKRVEIDYLIDRVLHRIRVTAVRQGAPATTSGASHA